MTGGLRLLSTPTATLTPGRDLALAATATAAGGLPAGTLLDDHLEPGARVAVETEARRRAAAWTAARRGDLVVDGVDLAWVWEIELFREAALPAVRFVRGVAAAAGATRAAVTGDECDRHEVEALVEAGLDVRGGGGPGAVRVPREAIRMSALKRFAIRARVPVPQVVRGSVRVIDHWSLGPLVRALAADGRLVPVLDPGLLHALPTGELLALGVRGGWIGSPGPLRRARSDRLVHARLAQLEVAGGDALDRLIDVRARRLLSERASLTPALVHRQRRAFAGGRIRVVVIPFDSIAAARSVLAAAREHGIPSLLVQHGFPAEPTDPDMRESDHIAAWSPHVDRGRPMTVTGNPGAPPVRGRRRPVQRPGRTLLLVQPRSVLSVRWDARVSRRSVEIGLAGLAAARPGSSVVLRPHPSDPDPFGHAMEVAELDVTVDQATPIEDLIAGCDLCIGGVSTATLQAGAAGVPVVFLDVTGMPTAWPFDGSSDVPIASDAGGLATALSRALEAPEVLGGEALADALGVRPGATDRLVDLVVEVAARGR